MLNQVVNILTINDINDMKMDKLTAVVSSYII
jgi:hypothetical protein